MILGPEPGPYCALIRAAAHDVILLTWIEAGRSHQQFYRVQEDLRVLPLNADSDGKLDIDIPEIFSRTGGHLPIQDEELEHLFSSEWHEWLAPALEAQLRHWRKHHVENYFHHTPFPIDNQELWCCIKGAAFQAITRFRNRLDRKQVEICLAKSRKGRALFRRDRLFQPDRRLAVSDFAEDALRHASDHLTDEELTKCATLEPQAVFRFGENMSLRAYTIAILAALRTLKGSPLGFNLQTRVSTKKLLDSVIEYPQEWHDKVAGGLPEVLNAWELLGVTVGNKELDEIHLKMPPEWWSLFVLGLASRI